MYSDHVQGHSESPPHSEASHASRSTEELQWRRSWASTISGIIDSSSESLCSFAPAEGAQAEILGASLSYGRRPASISPAALLGGHGGTNLKRPSGKILYDSAVQKLLDELGLSLRLLDQCRFGPHHHDGPRLRPSNLYKPDPT
jgi:hypothetical protein